VENLSEIWDEKVRKNEKIIRGPSSDLFKGTTGSFFGVSTFGVIGVSALSTGDTDLVLVIPCIILGNIRISLP
jgi:hypothetical protein